MVAHVDDRAGLPQVELARAEARSKTLEEENAHLLNRWRLKVSEEAKKMNEANEFYHQVQQMAKNPLSLSSTPRPPTAWPLLRVHCVV